ncbi:sensor histidine kinase KdpD [Barnesiella sp. CU968]|jgi:signal transduction histidine kinase|uniref:sensor histidine kinase n=1 Tax=Barnesiella sp. CU968 TaxID=2780099 RepID=UPI000F519FC2|nr:HAMP domain-containing sensor histidine kinase [Barnesiella sp. CU968]MBJ2193192.1 HAMP domain-containing histidine kinase [Muribaculaceae bacterium]MBJ2197839.1 HAMP domain-containing histidine kinase [Muribaculaceae bacterium]MCI9029827.1 HAMP domain-containing histidine kinase [Muribaculaceae bacterium]ROS82273.1 sensor histidine kinase [Muribaculaceae bacterium Isolate-036 (Harlan)]
MKRFKTISTTFIVVIAAIFTCNVYYLVSLYNSIRSNVERDVMTALADADIDDLMYRAGRAQALASNVQMQEDIEEYNAPRKAEASTYKDENGQLISVRTEADGTVIEERAMLSENSSYSNQMVDAMSRQFHAIMDKYIPYDMAVMDSVLYNQLSNRFIYPEFLCVEVVNSNDSVICGNPKLNGELGLDSFSFNINSDEGIYYKAYMTPLTRHILSQMFGIIITVFLLMIAFSLAFWYLFRTVSRLRTIEEMKDDFVSNMTHELKTPIAIAYSANDALLNYDTSNDPDKKTKYLTIANKQLKRLGELVENILAMSMERRKTMKLRPEDIQLREFVEEIAAAQRMRGDKDITINVNVADNIVVEADTTHLANVLNNLIDNAIKYSDESVEISISGDNNELSVRDNGIGIPSKSIPYLFNKFYRVPHGNRQDVRGYGIGLYYVKGIIDKMGWSIEVKSTEGKSSVFTIKFNKNEQ